jgi:hypothetical protein
MAKDSEFAAWMREAAETALIPAGVAAQEIEFALLEACKLATSDSVDHWIQEADRGNIRPQSLPAIFQAAAHILRRLIESNTRVTLTIGPVLRQRPDRIWHFHSKLAGVSHANDDGTSRQSIIRKLQPREMLFLYHDRDNRYDPNAMMVCRKSKEQVGYLNRELAAEVVERVREGYRYALFVSSLTGGTPELPTRGVNVLLMACAPEATADEVQSYLGGIEWEE